MEAQKLLEVRWDKRPIPGSWDEARPGEQMQAIDLAMRDYFGADDWLKARDKQYPGLRRKT